ncbi:MAG: Zn-ribbon domain-containing OB-fold protein [Promethearchaeota archaeon]
MGKLEYIRKQYERTRTMPGKWYLGAYKYKYNTTRMTPFREALKNKKLIGLKCRSCNMVYFPPTVVCGNCLVRPDKWVPLRETGVVSTFTATYVKDPETGEMVSSPVIAVRPDGADTTHIIEMPGVDFDKVYVGMPVRVKWRDETVGSLDDIECYEPIEDYTADMPLLEEEDEE